MWLALDDVISRIKSWMAVDPNLDPSLKETLFKEAEALICAVEKAPVAIIVDIDKKDWYSNSPRQLMTAAIAGFKRQRPVLMHKSRPESLQVTKIEYSMYHLVRSL